MIFLYKVLDDIPPPTAELINSVDRNLRPVSSKFYYGERTLKNWNDCNPIAGKNIRQSHADFEQWVKTNITNHIVDAGVNYVSIDTVNDIRSTGAHTDGIREYVLLWEIENGGHGAELCFWQEENEPKILPPKTHSEDLSKLTLLDKIKLPQRKWTLINATVLHSVENLYQTRINFQISLLNQLAVKTITGIDNFEFLNQY